MDKVKIGDIAAYSGVSLATVSRFFNKPELLAERTKSKIDEAIRELGYSQDHLARILVTGKSNLAGVIFPNLHLSYYAEILNQLIEQGKARGCRFIVYTSNESKESELSIIADLASYRIRGLILLSHLLDRGEVEGLQVPVISIERAGGDFMQINSDNFTGGKLAGDLLVANGCDVFVHINNSYLEELPSFKRIVGFELSVQGRPYERVIQPVFGNTYSPEASKGMGELLESLLAKYPGRKMGIFCSNDDIANLALRECVKSGVRIPDAVELIGYDNSPISDSAVYPITSIEQNIPLIAQIAVESLDNYRRYESIVPARLVKKETTS
ncbi:MAG: LacI family transcriptional regulator [Lachnospiraceae bacterium]|jgi:LacI family sucrose operon transcriptional repressor|nr:LacI family transcriptional regulator [Lachnospiraceae bacterium]